MKHLILATLLALPVVHAQDTPAPTDFAARRQSVVNLQAHIASREQRLTEIATDIRALDDRNEKRIDSIVRLLSETKDSQETKTRINALKADVIAGLRKSITIYQQKRADILSRMRADKSLPMQALTKDMDRFDERTKLRVDQIMALAKSMPASESVEKYESDGGSYWNGWFEENTRISEDWKQNRRQGVATGKNLRELREALEKSINSLEARKASTEDMLQNRKLSDAERAIQQQELGRTDAVLANLKQQLVGLAIPGKTGGASGSEGDRYDTSTPAENAVNEDSAAELKDRLEDARGDISRDFWDILRKYAQAANERDKIIALKANLDAREKWLAEHDKGEN